VQIEKEFFKDYDFVFLGDTHAHQYMADRLDKNNNFKPWMGYPGTLIQQNFGETIQKGYLVWDIKDKNDWNVDYVELENKAPFLTIPWNNSVENTIKDIEENHGASFLSGARYRITSSMMIPQFQSRQLDRELRKQRGAAEVIFQTDRTSKMDSVSTTSGLKISKTSLAKDAEAIIKLYREYLKAHKEIYSLKEEELHETDDIIRRLLNDLNKNTENFGARNLDWSIKEFEFDNLYGYGEGNKIDFSRFENIVGVFGKNRSGKSSLVAALLYVLFNTTDRGSVKNAYIINDQKDYCRGSVRINVGGTDYIIERRTERTIPKKKKKVSKKDNKSSTTVNLWKIRIDELGREVKVSSNGVGRDDTDRIIRELIGTSDDFLLTTFASQGNLNGFIEVKATKRKEFLNRFLELDVFDKLYDIVKKKYSSLNNISENFSSDLWSRTISNTEKEITKLEASIKTLTESVTTLTNKRDEISLWIATHENQAATVERKTVENLKREVQKREREIISAQKGLESNQKELAKKTERLQEVKEEQTKYDLETLREDLNSMQDLKTTLEELKNTLNLQTAELKTQQKAVNKLSKVPCDTSFPECHFIKDGHLAKKTIEAQKATVEQMNNNLDGIQKSFEKHAVQDIARSIKVCEDLSTEHELLDTKISGFKENIEQRKREIVILEKDLKNNRLELQKANDLLDKLESNEFKQKKKILKKTQEEVVVLETKRNKELMSLGANQQKLQKLLKEQEDGKDLLKKLRIYESIQSAFSKKGIPAMILKNQLPAVNREMAKVLNNLVDFTVTLETDVSANIMDVYFEDGKSKRVIELGSGMEKTICSLALRVALGNLSSLPRPDIFILDESFGALDEDNLQKGMELLSLFNGYFKSIFVITHISPIKEVADGIIEIKSNGIESSLYY
jgi:DNA repair exonuclease SbcCD ATPase subunit